MTASRWFADGDKIPFGWVPYQRTSTGTPGGFYAYQPFQYLFKRFF